MKHKENTGRSAAGHVGVFAVTLMALWLVLYLAALIPNAWIRENMERSALSYRDRSTYDFCDGERWNAIQDNYADAIWLNVAWNMGEGDALTATLNTRYYNGDDYGENAGLYLSVTEGAEPNVDYTRYWHGTAAFLRLGHLFTDVEGIKLMGFAAVLVLAAVTALVLIRSKHWDMALLLGVSLAAVQVWNIRLSIEYQPAFVLTFLLCPAYLLLERRGDEWLTRLSVAGGVAIAFFDFLTTETMTILLPLILVAAVRAKEGRLGLFRQELGRIAKCGVAWGISYAGTFLVKWTAASLLTGENAFVLAMDSVAERVSGQVDPSQIVPTSIFSSILANLTVLFGGTTRVQMGRALLGTAVFALVLLSVWYLLRGKKGNGTAAALLAVLGSVVFARYLVLNNHSYLHEFFTYRALICPILASMLAVRLNIALPQKKRGRK